MVETLEGNAHTLGLDVETAACDAAELPFDDESFDLVLGHAVLHHLPDLDRAFSEFHRVLAPGGTLFFAGEPSRHGDRIAAVPKRAALRASLPPGGGRSESGPPPPMTTAGTITRSRVWSTCMRSCRATSRCMPPRGRLRRGPRAGRGTAGELVRVVQPDTRGHRRPGRYPVGMDRVRLPRRPMLQAVDRRALQPRLPPRLFYNLMLAAHKARS